MEYVKIVQAYPKVMGDFFDSFEADIYTKPLRSEWDRINIKPRFVNPSLKSIASRQ